MIGVREFSSRWWGLALFLVLAIGAVAGAVWRDTATRNLAGRTRADLNAMCVYLADGTEQANIRVGFQKYLAGALATFQESAAAGREDSALLEAVRNPAQARVDLSLANDYLRQADEVRHRASFLKRRPPPPCPTTP
jgi:hypothetical protein